MKAKDISYKNLQDKIIKIEEKKATKNDTEEAVEESKEAA